jgi:hypothetical protein
MEEAGIAVMQEVRKSETSIETKIIMVIEQSKIRTKEVMRASLAEMVTEMAAIEDEEDNSSIDSMEDKTSSEGSTYDHSPHHEQEPRLSKPRKK